MTGSATLERDLEQLTAMLGDAPKLKCDYRGTGFAPLLCEEDATYRVRLGCGHGWNACDEHVRRAHESEYGHHCTCGRYTDAKDVVITQL